VKVLQPITTGILAPSFSTAHFGYAPTFGFGLRESFAGGSVDQYAMDALIVIQAQDAA